MKVGDSVLVKYSDELVTKKVLAIEGARFLLGVSDFDADKRYYSKVDFDVITDELTITRNYKKVSAAYTGIKSLYCYGTRIEELYLSYCSELTSLEGSPSYVGIFVCIGCPLKNLKWSPECKRFAFTGTHLETYKYLPKAEIFELSTNEKFEFQKKQPIHLRILRPLMYYGTMQIKNGYNESSIIKKMENTVFRQKLAMIQSGQAGLAHIA